MHKTTVYRRWGTKADLVSQALAAAAESLIEVPGTGRVDDGLRLLSRAVQATLASPRGAATTRGVLAGAAASAEIRGRHRRPRDRPRRAAARAGVFAGPS